MGQLDRSISVHKSIYNTLIILQVSRVLWYHWWLMLTCRVYAWGAASDVNELRMKTTPRRRHVTLSPHVYTASVRFLTYINLNGHAGYEHVCSELIACAHITYLSDTSIATMFVSDYTLFFKEYIFVITFTLFCVTCQWNKCNVSFIGLFIYLRVIDKMTRKKSSRLNSAVENHLNLS